MAGRYRADHLLVPGGWHSPGWLEIDARGTIAHVSSSEPSGWDASHVERLHGFVLPGIPNLHSHAHQRALAGFAEGVGGGGGETFWSWRDRMYDLANRISPDAFEAVAAWSYVEGVKAGFTAVGEFHYLHNDPDGRPYADPLELGERVLAAARTAGVAVTLLPVLYSQGGIGLPPEPGQRRFVLPLDRYLGSVESLVRRVADDPLVRIGLAPHSLRAVTADEVRAVAAARLHLGNIPCHIHVAEQTAEVADVRRAYGVGPAAWLRGEVGASAGWTFIHATHTTVDERRETAAHGIVTGLCPTTEANLGDGIFPLDGYTGFWGIGSDSNIVSDPATELRLLHYGQRLTLQRRDPLLTTGDAATEQPGRLLVEAATSGGARSLAQPIGTIEAGNRADLIVLDPDHPALIGQTPRTVLDGWIFAAGAGAVRDVMVAGTWVVRDRRHADEDAILARFRAAMKTLQAD